MLKFNYHTHSEFCDGQESLKTYVETAIERGFTSIGFSSHAPAPFETDWLMPSNRLPEYFAEIEALKTEYEDIIEIHAGLEIDYIPGITGLDSFVDYPLDFTIGSVHYLAPKGQENLLTVDGPQSEVEEMVFKTFKGDVKAWVQEYYNRIVQMVGQQKPDILGHFDLIKKRNTGNRFFNENDSWYKDIVQETIKKLASLGPAEMAIEINTGGISRGATETIYPSPWMLKEFLAEGFDFILSSDAHHPDHLDFYFKEAALMAQKEGAKCLRVLKDGRWQDLSITDFI